MDRDFLKEAIADAKAVKETAIANAKAALEEAFTPHLKSMLAAKLEEMDKDEDVEEAMKAKEEKDMMEEFEVNEGKDEMDEEFDLNEILAELEGGGDEEEEMEAGEEEIEAGEEAEMEAGEMGDEEVDLEDMTEDDLKSFIEDVIADMVAAGELEAGEEMEAEDEMGDMEELEEMDEVSWNEKNNPARGATLDKLAPTKVGQTLPAYAVNESEEVEEMDEGGSDAEWDEILDGYEDYVDSYIAILKKQADDPSDMSIMTESMELMGQGTEWTTKMAESSSEFGTEQLTRMTEIQTKLANSVSGL